MARVIANVLVLGCLGVVAACEPESTDDPDGGGGGGAASGGRRRDYRRGFRHRRRCLGWQRPAARAQTGGKATGGMATGGTASGTGGNRGTGGGATNDSTPSAGCGSPAGLASGRASIDVNGKTREYILRLPDNYDQNRPYRLIFAWHHLTGTAQMMASMGYYGLQAPSANQAILVAPEGVPANDKGELGWPNKNGEDVDFYLAMLDRFRSELCIDENRIFSLGFSYGAMFSFTLACTRGHDDPSHCTSGGRRHGRLPEHATGGRHGLHRHPRQPALQSPASGRWVRPAQRLFDTRGRNVAELV